VLQARHKSCSQFQTGARHSGSGVCCRSPGRRPLVQQQQGQAAGRRGGSGAALPAQAVCMLQEGRS
jgi:hypothetical protein